MPKPQLKVFGENELQNDEPVEGELEGVQPTSEPVAEPTQEPPAAEPEQKAEAEPEGEEDLRGGQKRIRDLSSRVASLERENQQYRENYARLDERQKQVREAREAAERAAQQAAGQPQNPYDKEIDPVGHDNWEMKQKLAAYDQRFQQMEQQFGQAWGVYQQSQQQQQMDAALIAQANEFSRTAPDYGDAVRYAAQVRMETWQAAGYSPDQARNIVLTEAQSLAAQALASGKSAPSIFYNLAKQWGYKGATNGNGKPTTEAVSAAARTLNQVKNGQAMQGLNRAPGGSVASNQIASLTSKDIAEMPDAQWNAIMKDKQLAAQMQQRMDELDMGGQ